MVEKECSTEERLKGSEFEMLESSFIIYKFYNILSSQNFRYTIITSSTIIRKGHPYCLLPLFLPQLIKWELPIFPTSQVTLWCQAQ